MKNKEAIEVLNGMIINDKNIPKAATSQKKKNIALRTAIKALKAQDAMMLRVDIQETSAEDVSKMLKEMNNQPVLVSKSNHSEIPNTSEPKCADGCIYGWGSSECGHCDYRSEEPDCISRQAAIDIERRATVDTNPEHFESHQKFVEFMDDAEISSFGRWQWSNGFNTALTAVGIDLKRLPPAQPERKKGKWIPVTKIYKVTEDQFPKTHIEWVDATEPDEIDAVRCSECGEVFDFQDARNWCTECGTDMR